jgi:hypothetical protein
MRSRASLIALLTLAADGCFVPRPQQYQRIPELRGIVVDAGTPIQGARVWYSEDQLSCRSEAAVVLTGADGAFRVDGLQRFRLGTFITGGDPGLSWALCIQSPARTEVLRQAEVVMGYEAPRLIELRCDVANTELCQRTSISR